MWWPARRLSRSELGSGPHLAEELARPLVEDGEIGGERVQEDAWIHHGVHLAIGRAQLLLIFRGERALEDRVRDFELAARERDAECTDGVDGLGIEAEPVVLVVECAIDVVQLVEERRRRWILRERFELFLESGDRARGFDVLSLREQ